MIREIILIYLPAMIANMAPVVAQRIGVLLWLDRPLNTSLLGANKTIRGFVVGIIAGAITGAIMFFSTTTFPYQSFGHAIIFGAATGFGALIGDSVKSFCKRRLHIASGTTWMPFDQIDFVIGATLVGIFFIHIPLMMIFGAIVIVGFASYVVSRISVALHIKQSL